LLPATLPFADNFTRPASTTLGDPWSVDEGGFTINGSNQAQSASTAAALDVAALYGLSTGTVTVQAAISGVGGGVVADWNSVTQSGYALLSVDATHVQLYRVSGGTLTAIGPVGGWTGFGTISGNYTLKLTASPGSLTASIILGSGLVTLGTVLDSSYTS